MMDGLNKIDLYILLGAFLCPVFVMFAKIKNGKHGKYANIKNWVIAKAEIKSCGIKDQVFKSAASGLRGWRDVKGYTPYVVYEYAYKNRKYTGTKISPIKTISSNRSDSSKVVEKYPVGSVVDVYINPGVPADSYLEPVNLKLYMKMTDMLFSLLFPLAALVIVWMKHRS